MGGMVSTTNARLADDKSGAHHYHEEKEIR